jgi:chloramphenicol O-acetyltransferase type A
MKKALALDNWERKAHYEFFKSFEEPFFGVTLEIDCTAAYTYCKARGLSFFLYYLHCSLVAANQTPPFRYRIEDDEVYEYDHIDASPTINRPNGTFGFSYMKYQAEFAEFERLAVAEIERVRNSSGLEPAGAGSNVIHYSALPWLRFTALSHARSFAFKDSCPKISFGKITEQGGKKIMPVSIHVHHALVDGFHVAQFVDAFQQLMDKN